MAYGTPAAMMSRMVLSMIKNQELSATEFGLDKNTRQILRAAAGLQNRFLAVDCHAAVMLVEQILDRSGQTRIASSDETVDRLLSWLSQIDGEQLKILADRLRQKADQIHPLSAQRVDIFKDAQPPAPSDWVPPLPPMPPAKKGRPSNADKAAQAAEAERDTGVLDKDTENFFVGRVTRTQSVVDQLKGLRKDEFSYHDLYRICGMRLDEIRTYVFGPGYLKEEKDQGLSQVFSLEEAAQAYTAYRLAMDMQDLGGRVRINVLSNLNRIMNQLVW